MVGIIVFSDIRNCCFTNKHIFCYTVAHCSFNITRNSVAVLMSRFLIVLKGFLNFFLLVICNFRVFTLIFFYSLIIACICILYAVFNLFLNILKPSSCFAVLCSCLFGKFLVKVNIHICFVKVNAILLV